MAEDYSIERIKDVYVPDNIALGNKLILRREDEDIEVFEASSDPNVVDVVSDFGADPTGDSDDQVAFDDAVSELVTAGGGLIQLRAKCRHNANLDLTSGLVSLAGHGTQSIIHGISGAGVPIIETNVGAGSNTIRDLQLIGNRGGNHGPGIEPGEYGIRILDYVAIGAWMPVIENVTILGTGNGGVLSNAHGMHIRGLTTFWTGGPGLYMYFGAFDSYCEQVDVGAVLDGTVGIQAWGGQTQWTNCQSYAGGTKINTTGLPGGQWDSDNYAFYGWSIGWFQTMRGCISEDNPVGFYIVGGHNNLDLESGGDHRGLLFANPIAGSSDDNDIKLKIRCNDAYMPEHAVDVFYANNQRVVVSVDWESQNDIANAVPPLGVPIRDTEFKVFNNANLSNQYGNKLVLDGPADKTVYHQASSGALTPDVADGLTYYVSLNAGSVTINPIVHRYGLSIGQIVRFVFTQDATGGRVVDWAGGWSKASQPSQLPNAQTVMEFVQNDNAFAAIGFTGLTRRPANIEHDANPLVWSNLMQWHKATSLLDLGDGDAVASWADLTGNGIALAQSNATKRPSLRTGAIGSKPAVRFDGVDDALATALFSVALAQPITIHVVARFNKVATASPHVIFDGVNSGRISLYQTTGPRWSVYGGSGGGVLVGTVVPDLAPHVLTLIMSPAGTAKLYIDNVLIGTTAGAGTAVLDGLTLGAQAGGGGQFSPIDIGEILVFSGAQSSGARQAVAEYLGEEWKIRTLPE